MAARPLIKESLLILNASGADPSTHTIYSHLRLVFIFIFLLTMFLNVLLDMILKWQGLKSMENLAILTAFIQVFVKLFIIAINRSKFIVLLKKMDQFWAINKYGREVQKEIEDIYIFTTNIMKYMMLFLVFGIFIFYASALFMKTRQLAFPMYYPTDLNRSPDYQIVFCLEIVTSLSVGFPMIGFDFLFVSLVINITCELKIIKEGFRNIKINPEIKGDSRENLKEIYSLIEHHNLILECIKSIGNIYSFWLLNLYLYNMVEMCVGMLSVIASGFPPSLSTLFQYAVVVMFFMIELFFYCATGQYLITETESVSATVYEIDWWIKTQPNLRRALMLVIQRANKTEILTAGGMFALNLPSFRKVTRSALSFFTLVNAVYKDS